jgi:hypothetical protein
MTSFAHLMLRRSRRRGSSDVLRGSHSAMEETAEERRHAVAIVVAVVGLGGALVAAVVARDARDGLRGGLLLHVRETRLVVERSRNGHLMGAALLLLPCGPDVVDLLWLFRGLLFDGEGVLPEAEEAPARRDLLRARRVVDNVGGAQRGTRGGLLRLRGADLLAGDLDNVWMRVDAGRTGGEERMGSRTKRGGLGAGLGNSSSTGASCGHNGEFLFEGRQGRMLDTAGSGSKEEAESTLGRVIMIVGIVDWGYRSEKDRDT